MRTRTMGFAAAALVGSAALLLAGCTTGGPAPAGTGGTAAGGPDVDAAQEFLAPWLSSGQKKLLIDEPLAAPIPDGLKIAYLDVGTPVAKNMWQILQDVVKATGIQLDDIQTGQDPQSISTGMNTVVEGGYDGVINITLDPQSFQTQLAELKAKNVPIVSGSVMDTRENGMPEAFNGPDWMTSYGEGLAAAAVVRSEGKTSDFVLYTIPEFPFAQYQVTGFQDEMSKLCAGCNVRVVDIPIVDLGSTSTDDVVSDLQAHPETGYAVMIGDEGTVGLKQKLDLAGIDVKWLGSWAIPPNLQQVASGDQDATFPVDFNLMMWTVADQLFREITKTSYEWPDAATRATALQTLVTKDNASQYPGGYLAIPDYQTQFEKLWGIG